MSTDVIVLCAGLGTRLRPLTLERAKPAVPLLNRPLVGYSFDLARTLGCHEVTINTHWLPETMEAAARSEARGLALNVSHEPVLLGTGGGLWQARERGFLRRDRDVLVLNGDVLFEADLPQLLKTHRESGASATMVLRAMPAGASYSPIEVDADGRIRRIGKYGQPGSGKTWLFTGVHVLSPEAMDLLPAGESSVVETVYAPLLARGARVQAAFDEGRWLDLGDPEGYLEAHLALLAGPLIAEDASVSGSAQIVRSAIGSSALVGEGARVVDSVLWPGAKVDAGERLQRIVVTPRVRVPVPAR